MKIIFSLMIVFLVGCSGTSYVREDCSVDDNEGALYTYMYKIIDWYNNGFGKYTETLKYQSSCLLVCSGNYSTQYPQNSAQNYANKNALSLDNLIVELPSSICVKSYKSCPDGYAKPLKTDYSVWFSSNNELNQTPQVRDAYYYDDCTCPAGKSLDKSKNPEACVATEIACTSDELIALGSGIETSSKTWSTSSNSYGECLIKTCQSGFTLVDNRCQGSSSGSCDPLTDPNCPGYDSCTNNPAGPGCPYDPCASDPLLCL